MAGEVIAGMGAFKALMDITKSLIDMDATADRNAAVIDLQKMILSAQESQMALLERVGQLEKQVAQFEEWDAERERYEMQALSRGFVAYVLKAPERSTAPPHALCTNCYERRFKSVLQSNGEVRVHQHAWICPSCRGEFACQSRNMDRMIAAIDQPT